MAGTNRIAKYLPVNRDEEAKAFVYQGSLGTRFLGDAFISAGGTVTAKDLIVNGGVNFSSPASGVFTMPSYTQFRTEFEARFAAGEDFCIRGEITNTSTNNIQLDFTGSGIIPCDGVLVKTVEPCEVLEYKICQKTVGGSIQYGWLDVGGGGTALTTATSVAVTGEDVIVTPVGATLETKGIEGGDGITASSTATDVVLDLNAANVGGQTEVMIEPVAAQQQFRTLQEGNGITLTQNPQTITVAADASGLASSIAVTGEDVITTPVGADLEVKGVQGRNGITATSTATDVVLDINATNIGAGVDLMIEPVGAQQQFKTLVGGPGVAVSANPNDILIASSTTQQIAYNNSQTFADNPTILIDETYPFITQDNVGLRSLNDWVDLVNTNSGFLIDGSRYAQGGEPVVGAGSGNVNKSVAPFNEHNYQLFHLCRPGNFVNILPSLTSSRMVFHNDAFILDNHRGSHIISRPMEDSLGNPLTDRTVMKTRVNNPILTTGIGYRSGVVAEGYSIQNVNARILSDADNILDNYDGNPAVFGRGDGTHPGTGPSFFTFSETTAGLTAQAGHGSSLSMIDYVVGTIRIVNPVGDNLSTTQDIPINKMLNLAWTSTSVVKSFAAQITFTATLVAVNGSVSAANNPQNNLFHHAEVMYTSRSYINAIGGLTNTVAVTVLNYHENNPALLEPFTIGRVLTTINQATVAQMRIVTPRNDVGAGYDQCVWDIKMYVRACPGFWVPPV